MGLLKVKSSGLGSGNVIPSRSKRSEKPTLCGRRRQTGFRTRRPLRGRFDESAGIEIAFVVACGRDQTVHDEPPRIGIRAMASAMALAWPEASMTRLILLL